MWMIKILEGLLYLVFGLALIYMFGDTIILNLTTK